MKKKRKKGGFVVNNGFNEQNNNFYQNSGGHQSGGGGDYAYTVLTRPKSRVWSVLALMASMVGLFCCCCINYAGLILGAVGIILAIISRKSLGYFDTTSIFAIIFSIFSIVLSAAILAFYYAIETNPDLKELFESYLEYYEGMYGEALPSPDEF